MNALSNPSPVAPATRLAREFAGFCVFLGVFVATLAYFAFIDVYDRHFFEKDYSSLYNALRVVFTAYFFWLVSFVGQKALTAVAGKAPLAAVRLHERLALGFFTGAAVLTVAMLVLGYLNLYWRAVAAVIAIAIVALSYRDFVLAWNEARASVARFIREGSTLATTLSGIMIVAVIISGGALLLVKGLYPQGGHDYYQHYSQFYTLVIDNHGIWPNDFWYHYYYSKGVGLTFLGMLLTDALAPSLVAYCYAAATALALFSLLNRICPRTLWPWVAVVLYLALNVHTLGTGFYAANGGWGHFQKPQELNSPILIGILWMSAVMVGSEGGIRRLWWWGAAASCFTVAYVVIISSAIVGLFCVLAMIGFFFVRRSDALAFFGLAVAAGCGLVSVLVLNYLTSGLPSDIGLDIWWPFLDLKRLNEAGTLFDITNTVYRRAEAVARGVSFAGFSMLDFLKNVSRFDVLAVFMCGALAGVLVWAVGRLVARLRSGFWASLGAANVAICAVVLLYLVAMTLFSVLIGSSEPISYVRVSSYGLPLMVVVSAIVWQIAIASVNWPAAIRVVLAYAVPIGLAGVTLQQAYANQKPTLLPVLTNAARFVDGRYSIYDGYCDQAGWPALPDSRAIYPGMFEAYKTIGPGHRLWSFNVHSYCMVPGCLVETQLSSSMSKDRAEILYGSPVVAQKAFQRAGLNYFFISTYLDIRDPLLCTPLFSPDTIRDHLGVKWTNGTDVLLTWKGPGIEPLSAQWVDKYRAALKASPHTPDCSGEGPAFSAIGRRVHNEVISGKRWGREVEQPK